jgi:hypothetical protein
MLEDGTTLVSTTDLKSRIAYCNPAFIQLDSVTQQNAAMVEQLSSTSQRPHGQAGTVAHAVDIFRMSNRRPPQAAHGRA